MEKKNKKNTILKNPVVCIDCEMPTTNYYMTSVNKGRVYRCADCHEKWVIRTTRIDIQHKNMEEQQ